MSSSAVCEIYDEFNVNGYVTRWVHQVAPPNVVVYICIALTTAAIAAATDAIFAVTDSMVCSHHVI